MVIDNFYLRDALHKEVDIFNISYDLEEVLSAISRIWM